MLVMYVLAALFLTATSAVAVEHPVSRHSRSHGGRSNLELSVKPKAIKMYKSSSLTVHCRARGGLRYDDVPFITFYRQIGTSSIMPLSSSSYGVSIEALPTSHISGRYQKASKNLHMRKNLYHILDKGDNLFYCKASLLSGRSETAYFIVHKV